MKRYPLSLEETLIQHSPLGGSAWVASLWLALVARLHKVQGARIREDLNVLAMEASFHLMISRPATHCLCTSSIQDD